MQQVHEKPPVGAKPTLKEILEQHQIDMREVKKLCSVPFGEIETFYERHIGLRPVLENILQTVNQLKREKEEKQKRKSTADYTLEMVYTRYIYG